jgi:acyl carrier protein
LDVTKSTEHRDRLLRSQLAQRELVVRRLQQLLVDRLHIARAASEFDPDAPLIGAGIDLDSLDALDLVVGAELAFGVRIEDDTTGRLYLRSLNTLADLIIARTNPQVPSVSEGASDGP